jgi:tetratricopeptide (TPR) repeat protein
VSLAPGVRLGAYEILSLIGAGGMGEVYRARDTRLGRAVAIKVLPAAVSEDESSRQRLFREARAISSLDHPNVCALYDVGHESGIDYLVMQYLEGETLAALLRKGALPVESALRYASEIGDALVAAHARGIVHRDLKPANVMITSAGARLLDFGLAVPQRYADPESATHLAVEEGAQTITGPGRVLGTLPYMAPEQLEGLPADARSDIFSFGAVLYEMLTGRRPFVATPQAGLMTQILATTPPPPSRLNPKVTRALDQVVARCLAKLPAERWQTARAVLNALTVAVNESRQPVPMRRWVYAAAAAVLAIVVAGGWPYVTKMVPALKPAATATVESTTLAILPFDVQSADPAERAFWSGLAEAVVIKLTQLPPASRLHVIPSADVAARKVRTADDARVEIGATRIIRGRVSEENGAFQVSLDLADTHTGKTVRSTTLTADRRDPAASHNALAEAIVALLGVRLTASQRARLAAPEGGPGAYDFYLQGIGYLQNDDKPENVDTAIAVLTHAVDLDPSHAPAYAGLGRAYWKKYETSRDVKWVDTARQACERALGLDEAEATPHQCLAKVEKGVGRYEKAVEEYQHALTRDGSDQLSYLGLAEAYQKLNEPAKAEEIFQRAIAAQPGYWLGYSWLGAFYYSTGRYREAEQAFKQVTALSPDNWRAYSNLGALYYMQDRARDAVGAFETSLRLRRNYAAASNLGALYYYEFHDYSRAAAAFRQAIDINASEYIVWGNYAWALQRAGETGQARDAFTKAVTLAEDRRRVNPKDASLLMALAEYQAALGKIADAAPLMDAALIAAPNDPRMMFRAGVLYEDSFRDRARAVEWLTKSLQRGYPWKDFDREPGLARMRGDGALDQLRRAAAPPSSTR